MSLTYLMMTYSMLKVRETYKIVECITRQCVSRVNKIIYSAQAFLLIKWERRLLRDIE